MHMQSEKLTDGKIRVNFLVVRFSFSDTVKVPRSNMPISLMLEKHIVGLLLGAPCNIIQKRAIYT